jgi:hypothetical protein
VIHQNVIQRRVGEDGRNRYLEGQLVLARGQLDAGHRAFAESLVDVPELAAQKVDLDPHLLA